MIPRFASRCTLSRGYRAPSRIADNGIGLPEDRARLFEPYVTTRDKGTGLGLPIVKKIIEEHGGTLRLPDAPVFGGSDRARRDWPKSRCPSRHAQARDRAGNEEGAG